AFLLAVVALGGFWLRPGGPPRNDTPDGPAAELFAPAVHHSAGLYPVAVAVADFNRDGKADLVVSNLQSRTVSVLLGKGGGSFRAAVNHPAGKVARKIVVGDFDRDGKPDLAVCHNGGDVCVLIGKGDGSFRPPVFYSNDKGGLEMVAADLDGDGK